MSRLATTPSKEVEIFALAFEVDDSFERLRVEELEDKLDVLAVEE